MISTLLLSQTERVVKSEKVKRENNWMQHSPPYDPPGFS
nr:hypothetical protein [Mucilaginibacter sp. FT3.2]